MLLSNGFSEEFTLKGSLFYPGSLNVIHGKGLERGHSYRVLVKVGGRWFGFPERAEFESQDMLFAIPITSEKKVLLAVIKDGTRTVFRKVLKLKGRRFRVSRIRVPRRYLFPPKKVLGRIRRENRLLRRTFKTVTERKFKSLKFIYPVSHPEVSTPFGAVRIMNGKKRSIHRGVDFRAKRGEPVFASLSGRVVVARELYYTGKTVIIDHGLGLYTLYAHLSRIEVREGQMVKRGREIGRVGSTGRSTGPHLHFGVYLDDVTVDPILAMGI